MTRQRFKWRWSDTAISVLAIIFIIIFVHKIQVSHRLAMPEQRLTMTIVAEQQDLFFKDTVKIGDLIYQKGSSSPFGKIIDVQEKPAQYLAMDRTDGRLYNRELDQLVDIHLVIESVGFQSLSRNPVVDNTFFHMNQYLPVMTHDVQFATRVIDIGWEGAL